MSTANPPESLGSVRFYLRLRFVTLVHRSHGGLDDLQLFAIFADDQMADVDEAIGASAGTLQASVVRLYGVVIVAVTLEMLGSVTTMMTVLTTMTSMSPFVVTETTPVVGTPGVPATTVETTSTTSLTFRDPPPTPHYSQIDS